MTGTDLPPRGPGPLPAGTGGPPVPSPALERAGRLNAANMLRSLLPLVVICLLIVGWMSFRQNGVDPVREVDPSNAVERAAARADYPLLAPAGLPEDYRPTSARTDAGTGVEGDPVTLEIGYVTPSGDFAGFVVSDDGRAEPVRRVLDGARGEASVDVGGRSWIRSTTARDETALSLREGDVTVVVTGSASDEELARVAASVRPYSG